VSEGEERGEYFTGVRKLIGDLFLTRGVLFEIKMSNVCLYLYLFLEK